MKFFFHILVFVVKLWCFYAIIRKKLNIRKYNYCICRVYYYGSGQKINRINAWSVSPVPRPAISREFTWIRRELVPQHSTTRLEHDWLTHKPRCQRYQPFNYQEDKNKQGSKGLFDFFNKSKSLRSCLFFVAFRRSRRKWDIFISYLNFHRSPFE